MLPYQTHAIGRIVKSDTFFICRSSFSSKIWLARISNKRMECHICAVLLSSHSYPLPHWSFSSLFVLHCPRSLSHTPFALPRRWLYGKTVCSIYAFCGMLFGICSLTTLTLLSVVCFVKVCYPFYGKSSKKLTNEMTHGLTIRSLSGCLLIYLWKENGMIIPP